MNDRLLMIVLALIVGYMCSYMIQNMCGSQLVEGGNAWYDKLGQKANDEWHSLCGRGHIDESTTKAAIDFGRKEDDGSITPSSGKCYSDEDCCGRRICVKYANKIGGTCQDDKDSYLPKCDYCK